MNTRHLSAPGKLFLAGEYAVLWGGTARILAVGPRARAAVRVRADRRVDVLLAGERVSGEITPLGVRWREDVPEGARFVARALDFAARAHGAEGPGLSVAFAPSPLVEGRKLGLGSSARATCLAAEAARWAFGASFDPLKLALLAHADAQGGKGSGGDVAACHVGGLVRYLRYDVSALMEAGRKPGFGAALAAAPPVDLAHVRVPRLSWVYAYTGHSASTPVQVRSVEARLASKDRLTFVEASDRRSGELERALAAGDLPEVLEAMAGLQALLDGLLGEPDEALARILAMARAFGGGGKQSGAGGGDGAILVAPTPEAAVGLRDSLSARGFHAFLVQPEPGLGGEALPDAQLTGWLDVAS